ncbi:uncharacterized protein [Spinacia oleracea]|uniref:Uncharacterized protein n=1 Tax=Spinacia oleracea TaxID=3562 RepID=A0ABM3QIZ3_SPIOL|nr:uncharacterized protein LOC130459799 [Spinacia oleracea]XP_056683330.1 uncharacterized protein LOC130459799 [Spinacia oleracea]
MYLFVVHAMQRTKTKASFWQLMDFINTKLLVELYRMKLLHLLQHVRFIFAIILNLSSAFFSRWACLSFSSLDQDVVHCFCHDLVAMCANKGMICPRMKLNIPFFFEDIWAKC